jgi:hypothetical protein
MDVNQFTVFAVVLLPILLIGLIIYRFNQKQVKRVLDGQRSLDDSEVWLRTTSPLQALVISRKETLNPDAPGIAKVDLDLEIQLPHGDPVQATTCWLVEIPSLPQLEPGKSLMVKFDPKKPQRVFPAVPWARAWLFGK